MGKTHAPKVLGLKVGSIQKDVLMVTNSISGGGAEISMLRLFRTLKTIGVNINLCVINGQISKRSHKL